MVSITFLTMGDVNAPSSRVRVLQYIPYLRQYGFKVSVHSPSPGMSLWQKSVFSLRFLRDAVASDIVVLQKRVVPPGVLLLLRAAGCRVVYDFDDAIFSLPLSERPFGKGRRFRRQIQCCDQIIVGNQYLCEYARSLNLKVAVLPSPVVVPQEPPSIHSPDGQSVSLGWIGTRSNHYHLDQLRDVLIVIQRQFPHSVFRVISDREWRSPSEGLRVTNVRWSLDTQEQELQKINIGVMPLEDTPYARGKCSYKALQYMAQAIPVVISPVGMNSKLVKDGWNGFLAGPEHEWISKLTMLIESPQLRKEIGRRGYQLVHQHYALDVCAPMLDSILRKAHKRIVKTKK